MNRDICPHNIPIPQFISNYPMPDRFCVYCNMMVGFFSGLKTWQRNNTEVIGK